VQPGEVEVLILCHFSHIAVWTQCKTQTYENVTQYNYGKTRKIAQTRETKLLAAGYTGCPCQIQRDLQAHYCQLALRALIALHGAGLPFVVHWEGL
jgi:hypothetical protein